MLNQYAVLPGDEQQTALYFVLLSLSSLKPGGRGEIWFELDFIWVDLIFIVPNIQILCDLEQNYEISSWKWKAKAH